MPRSTRDKKTPSKRSSKSSSKPPRGKSRRKKSKTSKRSVWSVLWRLIQIGLVLSVLGAMGLSGVFWYYGRDLPDVETLREYRPPQVTRVLARNGEVLGERYEERRTVVPLERVPRVLVLSLLAAEDADFYRHEGLDYPGLIRAFVRGLFSGGHFRGTSTLTQQLVKNLLLSPERTMTRKIRELLLARRLEAAFSKEEILEIYLNQVNFGHGRYGVQEASRFYFGCDVDELSLAQASLIAGLPQSPTHLSPRTHPEAAHRRQAFVLNQLERKRLEYWPDLTSEAIQEARDTEVEIIPLPDRDRPAPEVVAIARRTLREQVGREAAARGGYTIHTTIDRDLQSASREALRRGLRTIDRRQRRQGALRRRRRQRPLPAVERLRMGGTYDAEVTDTDDTEGSISLRIGEFSARARLRTLERFNPEDLSASAFAPVGARVRASILELPTEANGQVARAQLELGAEGAVIVIEPRTREVRSLIGGYEGPGFNRATQAVRQPGSTFKPFVYSAALLTRRYTPATIVVDAPGVYDDWRPGNYETWNFEGEIRLRLALARSINQVAVRVMEDVTPPVVARLAESMGITSALDPTLALALGASEVRPIELVNAYTTFAAGGRWAPYRLITRIEGPDGEDIPLPDAEPIRNVMTPAEAYVISSMLESVVRVGTARRAQSLNRAAAGKTGTSNDARDAWFVGFTANMVAGVWVGFDDRRPLGRRESGGRSALPIWIETMRHATEGLSPTSFAVPNGVETARVDPASGQLAYEGQRDAVMEVFLEGTVPLEQAPDPTLLDPSSFLMEEIGGLNESNAQTSDDSDRLQTGSEAARPEAASTSLAPGNSP